MRRTPFDPVTCGLPLPASVCWIAHRMDTEAFISWALDDSRTVEGRFTVGLLVEQSMRSHPQAPVFRRC